MLTVTTLGVDRCRQYGRYPMVRSIIVLTEAIEVPRRDNCAGRIYANQRDQVLYRIFGGGSGRK
ncbi:hypothetical protein IWX75_003300 [Arthrobacter sp. CAN_A6]